jgi:mannose-6-phosphate isomerase
VRDRVSIQVHPDDACARRLGLADGAKTEAWYVLRCGPRGRLCAGLKSRCNVSRVRVRAESGQLGDDLRLIRPRRGDAWFCRAGALHSFGGGIVMLEVQQNSDATFRLYDWGRVGADGRRRELHVDRAMAALGGRACGPEKQRPRPIRALPFRARRLVACDEFVMDHWDVRRPSLRAKGRRFEILHVLRGRATLRCAGWPTVHLPRGATALVPACVREYAIVPSREAGIIRMAEGT